MNAMSFIVNLVGGLGLTKPWERNVRLLSVFVLVEYDVLLLRQVLMVPLFQIYVAIKRCCKKKKIFILDRFQVLLRPVKYK